MSFVKIYKLSELYTILALEGKIQCKYYAHEVALNIQSYKTTKSTVAVIIKSTHPANNSSTKTLYKQSNRLKEIPQVFLFEASQSSI